MKRVFLAFAIVLTLSACGTAGGRTDTVAANGGENAATPPVQPPAARPVWIDSLEMISPITGWALVSTATPNRSSALDVARTGDGGKTWDLITPAAARAGLTARQTLLDAVSVRQAWVVGVLGRSSVVFGTADGGNSWSQSGLIAGDAPVAVAFSDAHHGWLLESAGAAMGQNPVRLYRTSDAGRSWSVVAHSALGPGGPPSGSGLPVACDKTGVAVGPATVHSQAGLSWITGFCPASWTDAVLVSHDGGAHWASPLLPIPQSACQQSGCAASEPQFVGRTTFLVIWAYPDQALLLSTTDGGANWRTVIMPTGAGPYPRIRFFGPADGIAVSAGSQGSIGRIFYLTSDGGKTWLPVHQGMRFDGSGASFDFVTPAIGFAWLTGTDSADPAPVMYQTTSSGRSWTSFAPRLG
jgi:photosystem II stability/assembly factor-like uncharacterized protein